MPDTETPAPTDTDGTQQTVDAEGSSTVQQETDGTHENRVYDAEYVGTLRNEAAGWRKKAQEAKATATQLEAERQALADQLESLHGIQAQLEAAETRANQFQAAAEAGLPFDLATRLTGSTAEELAADAQALAKRLGGQSLGQSYRPSGTGAPARNSLVRG